MENKKFRKWLVASSISFACVAATVLAVGGNKGFNAFATKGSLAYSISLESTNKLTADEITAGSLARDTKLGNAKQFVLNGLSVSADGFADMALGGYIGNTDAISDIANVKVVTSSSAASSYRLYYGSSPEDCSFYLENSIADPSSESSKTFTFDFSASYFKLVNFGADLTIDSIDVEFSCATGLDVKSEFSAGLTHQYFQNTEIDVPVGQVMLGSEVITASATVKDPDNQILTGSKITLSKLGTYTVDYVATKGESKYEKTCTFVAVSDVAFISSPNPSAVQSITPGTTDGLVYNLDEGDTLYFNMKTNVSTASFTGSYTILSPGLKTKDNSIFVLKVVEAVNPSNYLEVKFETYTDNPKVSVWARASNQHFSDGVETVFQGATPKFNILFDNIDKKVGAGSKASSSVFDLTDSAKFGAAWAGFTSDIYMSLECVEVDGGTAYAYGDYVFDNRNYAVSGKPSSRSSTNFYLKTNSKYSLTGYEIDVTKATSATYFFMSPVFDATYINATIVVKVIDTTDDSNFFYIVIESLTSANLRLSASSDGNPDLNHLVGSNQYAQAGGQLNVTLNLTDRYVSNWNAATGTCPVPESFTNCNSVRLEFTADCDINFKLAYLGDSNTWCKD